MLANSRRLLILFSSILLGCSSIKTTQPLDKQLDQLQTTYQNHTGFVLYDVEKDEIVYSRNSDKYFTPASNTKIFTLYSTLKTQGDSLPGLSYARRNDTLYIKGTADPSFLYPKLPASNVFDFLSKQNQPIVLIHTEPLFDKYGPGWSWDDYNYTYSVERSAFPIYGNAMTFNLDSVTGLLSSPQEFFKRYVMLGDTVENSDMIREFDSNRLTYYPSQNTKEEEFNIPFKYSSEIFARLLTDTLKRRILPVKKDAAAFNWRTVYSIPTDSAVRVMMQISDNFIAEQLMIMNGEALTDSLDSRTGIEAAVREYFQGIPDKPIWVDGSGLSRFNLFTPRSIVWLWKELYETYGKERLFSLIAQGGQKGTLKSYYVTDPPYIYGKTGTLSNNNSLSGFLVTKKGRLFIFSMMHNNYPGYSSPVKRNMERILSDLYENN